MIPIIMDFEPLRVRKGSNAKPNLRWNLYRIVKRFRGHASGARVQGMYFRVHGLPLSTEGPSWGHSRVVLGAIGSFLEPFQVHLSPKIDKVS